MFCNTLEARQTVDKREKEKVKNIIPSKKSAITRLYKKGLNDFCIGYSQESYNMLYISKFVYKSP